jgi:two-component system NtrC family response regulator
MAETRKPLLIIEDDPALQKQMRWAFDAYETVVADDRASAIAQLRRFEPAVVTMDLGLPPRPDDPSEGFALLQEMRQLAPETKIIVLTGQNDRANALRAIALGAYDFCTKPFDADVLGLTIDRAYRLHELQSEYKRLQTVMPARPLAGILTLDPEMQRVLRTVEKVAPTSATVLILGESGTGKELVARALHDLSPRAASRFVAINCAAIPETLLESELFGYEKGAFTGATGARAGLLESAAGGTVFLDEVGELTQAVQAKLLRVLEELKVRRVGGSEERAIDVRSVAATNRDLERAVAEGGFRADLFFRLNGFSLQIPPLRERAEDLPLLAESLLARVAPNRRLRLGPDAMARLASLPFEGNIRELRNLLERASLLADGEVIQAQHLGAGEGTSTAPGEVGGWVTLEENERRFLDWAVSNHGGTRRELAAKLGIGERTLFRKLRSGGGRGGDAGS